MALALILVAATVVAQQKPGKSSGIFRKVGQFKVWAATTDITYKSPNLLFDFRAKPGQKVKAQSDHYDFSASRVQMAFGSKTSEIQNAQATGGVTGEARDPDQVISFAANQADYKGRTGAVPARIDLTGNTKIGVRTPKFASTDPPTYIGESATIFFQPDGTIKTTMKEGVITGTALDPEPENEKKP